MSRSRDDLSLWEAPAKGRTVLSVTVPLAFLVAIDAWKRFLLIAVLVIYKHAQDLRCARQPRRPQAPARHSSRAPL